MGVGADVFLDVDVWWQLPGTHLAAAFMAAVGSLTAIGILVGRLVRRPGGPIAAIDAGPSADPSRDESSLLEAAWAYHKSGCNESAIALFTEALILNRCSVEALKGRGLCYAALAEFDRAMLDFHTWVLRDPESGDAYFLRAQIWRKLGLNGLAISDFRTSLRYSVSNAAAREAVEELARVCFDDSPEANMAPTATNRGEDHASPPVSEEAIVSDIRNPLVEVSERHRELTILPPPLPPSSGHTLGGSTGGRGSQAHLE
jgi:hypothetical protein